MNGSEGATDPINGKPQEPAPTDPLTRDSVERGVWRYARASRAHAVVDAADYFALMRDAMLAARQRIHLIGWDFDTRILIGDGRRWWNLPRKRVAPARLGAFVVWLVNRRKGLEVLVLKWNFGAIKALLRGSMVLDLIRWWRHPRIGYKLDSAHPLGCSHHQKIAVIDDRFAVCGGIDMAGDRWDTRAHLDNDPRRRRPGGQPYGPWHDCTMLLEGPVAGALGEFGRTRWHQAGGRRLEPCRPQAETAWPNGIVAHFTDVEVGIARTRSPYADIAEVREIEALFCRQIAAARQFIYAENQYFASRRVAEALAERLSQPDPPEVVVVMPQASDGWLEQTAMDLARVRLFEAVKSHDPQDRFSIWHPFTKGGTAIYVHAKLMIVDDIVLRIGSANMNNRSMGLDSECDVFIDAARPGNAHATPAITSLRHSLLAEHCGLAAEQVAAALAQAGGMAALAAESAKGGGRHLRPFVPRDLTDAEQALADSEALDPERPEEMLAFYRRGRLWRGGLGRKLARFRARHGRPEKH
jgi:phosphatidylserine/phosphatidylglycerophosphate/cardiolipin synthase-like enzyme